MGTSIFETFSSAFNNAMGKLLSTAITLITQPTLFQPTSLTYVNPTWWKANVIIAYHIRLRYLPTFHQIASQEEIVQRMNIGLHVMAAMKKNADRQFYVSAATRNDIIF